MQVFEFHFNPKAKDDLTFDSFCYEPENIYERKMGSLYMIGILKNVLPQNVRFLDNLAKIIKERYYKSVSSSPEKSLKESLRKVNEFLEKIAKDGDVSWLGNLSFAVVSLKNSELNFTKIGDLKVFLLRKGQIIDVDKRLKFEEIEPYPLKIFGNIVSGKLAEDDVIMVLTKEVSEFFQSQNLMAEIAQISAFEQKRLKEILNGKKENLSKISGICLIIILSKEVLVKEKETLTQKRISKVFSLKQVFTPHLNLGAGFSPLVKVFKLPKISLKKPALKIPKIKFKLPKPKLKIKAFSLGKRTNLVLALILFLALGFFIFGKMEEKQLKIYQRQLNQIQEKVNQGETYLIIAKNNPQAEKKANSLFEEAWQEISPLVNLASTFPSGFANQVLTLKKTISENLFQLSKLKIIKEIQPIFEFKPREFIPQKIISHSQNLYFFSSYSENIVIGNLQTKDKKFYPVPLDKGGGVNSAVALNDSILFFAKPDQLINFKEDKFSEPISLKTPYPEFSFNDFSSYRSNLYFLDNKNGKIIKYPYSGNIQWGLPQLWLENKKAKDFKSMAVDGSVWVLTKNNPIEKYYSGRLQEILELEIFPYPKEFLKIFTSSQLPYLYLLEPVQKRIVILNKSGQILQQFQSEKFDNLLDFSISEDGKVIYLLNGLKVYKILYTIY